MADLQVGAVGAVITLAITDESGAVVDLTAASVIELILRGPSGPAITRTASARPPASDGVVIYTTIAGDLQHAGKNRVQACVTFSGGTKFWTDVYDFTVGANL